MKTPEEIKKGLECCASLDEKECEACPYKPDRVCGETKNGDALAYIQQLESAQPKWISVNDREPECGVEVLTCDGYNNIYVAYRFEENLYYRPDVDGYLASFSASYWMPLPAPPNEK